MEFESILFVHGEQAVIPSEPKFFQDLQLDYILNMIGITNTEYDMKPYFYTFPVSAGTIAFRHAVFQDLQSGGLFQSVRNFCTSMQAVRTAYDLSKQCGNEVHAASFYMKAASYYWDGIQELAERLEETTLYSEGFLSFREYVRECMKEYKEQGFGQAVEAIREAFSQARFKLVVTRKQITITEDSMEENYLADLIRLLRMDKQEVQDVLRDVYTSPLRPSYLETTITDMLGKSKSKLFDELLDFYEKYPDFLKDKILKFEQEVQFYIGFLIFKEGIDEAGYPLSLPVICEEGTDVGLDTIREDHARVESYEAANKKEKDEKAVMREGGVDSSGNSKEIGTGTEFAGRGVYDMALLLKRGRGNEPVIANEFRYPKQNSFFVVTGPNQGGKTTFARSMGQAVYLAMMGLYVNAESLKLPYFDGLATHFEAEENLQSNSGKLKDEINRLAPMMKSDKPRQFVILNELFTTATTYDAIIMGQKVMKHFLAHSCYGIYVTHIQELAEETEQIISLVAQIEEGGQKRTYKMLPMKAQGYGYSESLVEKFELTYEDLIRRLP